MTRVVRSPRLREDIDKAVAFYELQSAELAMRFLTAFGDSVRLIRRHPAVGTPRYRLMLDIDGLRHVQTHAFPYLLFYRETADRLILARLLHASRDIAALLKRRQAPPNAVPTDQNPL